MIHNAQLKEYFEPYSKEEIVYRRYQEIQQSPETFSAQLQILKRDILAQGDRPEEYWWPEVNPSQNPDAVRALWYPFHDDIVVAKHMRYHPLFAHRHDFYEMIYVLDGSCTNHMDGETFTLNKGNICIIPPEVPHAVGVFDDSVIANILIRKSSFNRMFADFLGETSMLSDFFMKTIHGGLYYKYILFPGGSPHLDGILENLVLEEIRKDTYSSMMKKTLLLEAFVCLLREQGDVAVRCAYNTSNAEILHAIRLYVREHFQDTNLKDTAAHFNYSVPYLSRLIRQASGQTFTDMLREIKLTKACELLERSDRKINEISDMLGYDAPMSFARVFKKHMGVTPAEYRQNNRDSMRHMITRV